MNSRNEEILKFKKAPTPDDVSNFASELDALCPDVSLSYLGKSLRGRSIPILNLGCKNAKTKILYVACHHASEWICASVLLRFCFEVSALAAGGRSIYGINAKTLLSSRLICVIPMLNPDGVALQQDGTEEKDPMYDRLLKMNGSADFSKWQANGRGVDLNHNYNAAFEKIQGNRKKNRHCRRKPHQIQRRISRKRTGGFDAVQLYKIHGIHVGRELSHARRGNIQFFRRIQTPTFRFGCRNGVENDGIQSCRPRRYRRLRRDDRLVYIGIRQAVFYRRVRIGRKSASVAGRIRYLPQAQRNAVFIPDSFLIFRSASSAVFYLHLLYMDFQVHF